ncbi:DUF350 domain-containing protein [Sorangium sp. So ce233]|uniref:DUF350 domain-containing protein n=1 Tax=Sorangium sp. So ce233 TaxID=3133290 RepID=UPI003F63EFF2
MELSYVMGFGLGTTLALLALLRIGQRIFSPAHTVARDLAEGNAARRLLTVGQVLAVFLVAANAVKNCLDGSGFARDLLWVSAFAVVGLLLVIATGQLGIRLLLRARLPAEIERGNAAAGLAAGAHYVATGLITSRAIAGKDLGDLAISLGFFLLAQVTLHVFISLFRALTTYDDAEQIQGENLAAALSYAGATIAVAILIARALEGDFEGLFVSLKGYGGVLLYLLALYPVRQLLVQSLLLGAPLSLRGGRLDAGIAAERNEGMGALEAATYLATSLAIARLL